MAQEVANQDLGALIQWALRMAEECDLEMVAIHLSHALDELAASKARQR
jgi:hypothetical protein